CGGGNQAERQRRPSPKCVRKIFFVGIWAGSHSMDDNTLSGLRTQLGPLSINPGAIFSHWVECAVNIRCASEARVGVSLSDDECRVVGVIMALLGTVPSLGFAAILVRQAQWLMWFAQRWNSLATTSEIFPTRPGEIVRLNPGRVACWSEAVFCSWP